MIWTFVRFSHVVSTFRSSGYDFTYRPIMASNATLPEWFDPIETVVSYVFMLASFVTILLYWMEIIILITLRNSVYKGKPGYERTGPKIVLGMFYQIFTVGITVDVISLVNNYFGCVFPAKGYLASLLICFQNISNYRWFSDFYLSLGTFVGQMYLMIAWTARGIQGCTVVALALNRATAVCLPIKHKQVREIWNSINFWVSSSRFRSGTASTSLWSMFSNWGSDFASDQA